MKQERAQITLRRFKAVQYKMGITAAVNVFLCLLYHERRGGVNSLVARVSIDQGRFLMTIGK